MYIHKSIFAKFFIVICCSIYAASSRHNTKIETDFECPENWGYYEDPENCMKYYNCENGVAHSVNCRSGKVSVLINTLNRLRDIKYQCIENITTF